MIVYVGREYRFGSGIIGQTALTIANNKAQLEFGQALALGILCNALVCMAIWLTLGGRTTTDKIMAILFPITAFGAAGFEHSVANMTLFSIALLGNHPETVSLAGMAHNLLWVTLGNAVAGSLFMAAGYWFASKPALAPAVRPEIIPVEKAAA